MRLLELRSDGNFNLTKDLIDNIPPYAILSHTWGPDGEEVTFEDLINQTGENKAGYTKLQFCGDQAAKDELQYFWVDTCCINRSSSSELTEAINSMFRWYREAAKCYVYLSDVSVADYDGKDDLPPSFQKSRWFTRGWTLQELIAPKSVEFFSPEGSRLGDKRSMEKQIHEITGIAVQALRNVPLSNFSVAERLSWAAKRETTRKEDGAYSLLGMFDVFMSTIYGEGKENAFTRLRTEIERSTETRSPIDPKRSQYKRLPEIYQWLAPPDPSLNYQKAIRQRQAGTGRWFLDSEQYKTWRTNSASSIWLHGIPGCGKSILSSTILESLYQYCLDSPGKAIAYFYFDFNDAQKQTPDMMIRSLTYQLLQQCLTTPTSLETLFSSCQNGKRQPSLDSLLDVLHETLLLLPQSYLVLDALDECSERAELMQVIERMAMWQHKRLHLLVTSRKEREIEISLECIMDSQNIISLQREIVDKDIHTYVRQRLSDDKSLRKWQNDPSIRDEIEKTLMTGAHGMFRWAVCQLDTLGKCRNPLMLRKALAALPRTLDDTYERVLCSIDEEDAEYAVRVLRWLAFCGRPLSLEEISEAVAIDPERDPAFDRQEVLQDPLDVLSICSSLVVITDSEPQSSSSSTAVSKVVALAHYSVKEYLISERSRQGSAARYSTQESFCNEFLAKCCLGYLFQFQETDCLSSKTTQMFPLARYSARFWTSHVQAMVEETKSLNHLIIELFSKEGCAYLNWVRIYDPDAPWRKPDFTKMLAAVPPPVYYASLGGLTGVVELLLAKGADVNAQDGHYGNALQAASARGHKQIVELLLAKGADVNAQGGGYGNALQAASAEGYKQIVELLLAKCADTNVQGGGYSNALQGASARGHKQIVELLLAKAADINTQGRGYGNALRAASAEGYEQIVELLLAKGADVNAQGSGYGNALQAASAEGYEQIVKLLLANGADVNAQGGGYGSALRAASAEGYEQIVKLLLANGADVNAQGGGYGNALRAASAEGHEQIVKLLLANGADVNAQGGHHGNALQAASAEGYEQIVELLLAKGADVNAQGGHYGNALQAASAEGYEQIVELLLAKGAER